MDASDYLRQKKEVLKYTEACELSESGKGVLLPIGHERVLEIAFGKALCTNPDGPSTICLPENNPQGPGGP